jgi:hypothetical protein
MKKTFYILSMAVIVMAAVSCGGGSNPTTTPSEVVNKAFDALVKSDFETAKKYFTKDRIKEYEKKLATATLEEDLEIVLEEHKEHLKVLTLKIISEEIAEDGKTAKVTAEFKISFRDIQETEEWKVALVKESGEWKVNYKMLWD